jgi:hypothetical protein
MSATQDTRLVIHPATGEVISLDGDTAPLARFLTEVRELEQQLRDEKRIVTRELIDRMDREARYTLHTDGLDIKGDGPKIPTDYEAEPLRAELQEFVEAEVITQEALDRAVEPITTYKARAQGLNALRGLGDQFAAVIDRHAHPKENYERRVSITVKPGGGAR